METPSRVATAAVIAATSQPAQDVVKVTDAEYVPFPSFTAGPIRLTEQEKQVARCAALGLSYERITEALRAKGVIMSESRVRKLVAGIASRLPNLRGIAPHILVAPRAAQLLACSSAVPVVRER